MRTMLNVIWLVLGGLWLALGYMVAGLLALLPIVTIPIGLASFRMAQYVLWPFGKAVVRKEGGQIVAGAANVVWFVLCGWWLALLHVLTALVQGLTVIGLLNAVVNLKMIPVTVSPFGKRIVDRNDLHPGERPLHSI